MSGVYRIIVHLREASGQDQEHFPESSASSPGCLSLHSLYDLSLLQVAPANTIYKIYLSLPPAYLFTSLSIYVSKLSACLCRFSCLSLPRSISLYVSLPLSALYFYLYLYLFTSLLLSNCPLYIALHLSAALSSLPFSTFSGTLFLSQSLSMSQ